MAIKVPQFLAAVLLFISFPAFGQDTAPAQPAVAPVPTVVDQEKAAITTQTEKFSAAYINGDVSGIMALFTDGAYIVPVNGNILSGQGPIRGFWQAAMQSPVVVTSFEMVPETLDIMGDWATDVGYYNGETKLQNGKKGSFGGAYVTVWRKAGGVWRMQYSMWRAGPKK
ncbi:YybH family protein [Kordiimonas pumila]|uniref:YybH family protein n=1 Tax=Kordiimonas pumila TaxID=2161677 RepID=A0ABV7D0W3_9PROT|nr:nuclear transport factor 2 family protein [Kordiimonas pumila]